MVKIDNHVLLGGVEIGISCERFTMTTVIIHYTLAFAAHVFIVLILRIILLVSILSFSYLLRHLVHHCKSIYALTYAGVQFRNYSSTQSIRIPFFAIQIYRMR